MMREVSDLDELSGIVEDCDYTNVGMPNFMAQDPVNTFVDPEIIS